MLPLALATSSSTKEAETNLEYGSENLVGDPRFPRVRGQRTEDPCSMSDGSLFHLLTQLSLKLARDSVTILSRQEVVNELNSLTGQLTTRRLRPVMSRCFLISRPKSETSKSFSHAGATASSRPLREAITHCGIGDNRSRKTIQRKLCNTI